MAQVKIFGLRKSIEKHRQALSGAIHLAVIAALKFPNDKKFHRFIALEREDFIYPADRSENYTIIEISMFEGRSVEAKKELIHLIFANIKEACGIEANDVEITIVETPKCNWGLRGQPGDEIALNYKVNV